MSSSSRVAAEDISRLFWIKVVAIEIAVVGIKKGYGSCAAALHGWIVVEYRLDGIRRVEFDVEERRRVRVGYMLICFLGRCNW